MNKEKREKIYSAIVVAMIIMAASAALVYLMTCFINGTWDIFSLETNTRRTMVAGWVVISLLAGIVVAVNSD